MKNFLLASLAASLAAVTVATSGVIPTANAAPAGPSSVDTTINQLENDGYVVIVNHIGDGAPGQCSIVGVRPGHTYSRTDSGAPGAGNSPVTTVTSKTVYLDLSC